MPPNPMRLPGTGDERHEHVPCLFPYVCFERAGYVHGVSLFRLICSTAALWPLAVSRNQYRANRELVHHWFESPELVLALLEQIRPARGLAQNFRIFAYGGSLRCKRRIRREHAGCRLYVRGPAEVTQRAADVVDRSYGILRSCA
jgi:hypothetical protein